MKRLGSLLMLIGAAVGVILAIAMALNVKVEGVPLPIVIGMVKLTFGAALGLMGAGAILRRIGIRAEQRQLNDRAATRS